MFSFCLVVSSLHCNCVLLGDLCMVGDVGCSAKGDLFRWILALLSSWFLIVYAGSICAFLGYFIGGSSRFVYTNRLICLWVLGGGASSYGCITVFLFEL